MSTWFYKTSLVLERIGGQAARVFEIVRGLAYCAEVVVFAPLGRAAAPLPWPINVRARQLAETDYSWRAIAWKLVSFVRDREEG